MPLDLKDENGPSQKPRPPRREPILHTPRQDNRNVNRIVVVAFGVVVLASMVFLLDAYNVIDLSSVFRGRAPEVTKGIPPPATPIPADTAPESSPPPAPPVVAPREQFAEGGGRYTIYIAAYVDRVDAEEEVGRWVEAGFTAFVNESSSGWSRVALGRFERVSEARAQAEQLDIAFENGYWIGPM